MMGSVPGLSTFGLSERATLAIEAAVEARRQCLGAGGEWSVEAFADQVTRFLIAERLLPVHVAPDEVRRLLATRLAQTGGESQERMTRIAGFAD